MPNLFCSARRQAESRGPRFPAPSTNPAHDRRPGRCLLATERAAPVLPCNCRRRLLLRQPRRDRVQRRPLGLKPDMAAMAQHLRREVPANLHDHLVRRSAPDQRGSGDVAVPRGGPQVSGLGGCGAKRATEAGRLRGRRARGQRGAAEGTRTPTPLPEHGPEPCASANSATAALISKLSRVFAGQPRGRGARWRTGENGRAVHAAAGTHWAGRVHHGADRRRTRGLARTGGG